MNELIVSEDGSHTLQSANFGETYHSKYGAINESTVVFIDAGLKYLMPLLPDDKPIKIFEMGFGTGLNALLALSISRIFTRAIDYTTIEAYPISLDQAMSMNYTKLVDEVTMEDFLTMHGHTLDGMENTSLSSIFTFTKHIEDLKDYVPNQKFDLVFYDAFAPTAQPELWTEDIMKMLFDMTNRGGVLVTYCAKGSFKRALRAAGYIVEGLPGPKRKREITRAIKKDE